MALPVSYDHPNRELRTVRFYFADHDDSVLKIKWQPGIKVGSQIEAGQVLATILWDESEDVLIKAPAKCSGTIARRVVSFDYESLPTDALRLLTLERES